MNNFYNEEKKYSKLVNDLKNLPHIKAPENFEFNLMTRIENKNFGDSKIPKTTSFNIFKFLAPSAIVLTAFILFFIFYPSKNEIQNQIEQNQTVADTQTLIVQNNDKIEKLIPNKVERKSTTKKSVPSNSQNAIVENKTSKLQELFNQKAVSVDEYLSGTTVSKRTIQRSNIVKSGDEPIVDGFLIEKQTDKQTIEKYRAALDSLRKAQEKADSIKKSQK
ncbi:MAG: hypothetical protein N2321_03440 [Melioribacteraceae bacterium]|nr:hypothetical protein [Melioribacteraceae bacterium]